MALGFPCLISVLSLSLSPELDESLLNSIESSPIWRLAIDRLSTNSETDSTTYALPTDFDRRLIALIAAGEHELNQIELDHAMNGQRIYLVDGIRCMREMATRRLNQLYIE